VVPTNCEPVPPSSRSFISSWEPFSFNGLIDEVCIFSSALSDELIQGIFAAGEYGMCKNTQTLVLKRANGGGFALQGTAAAGKDVKILVSTNLRQWQDSVRLQNPTGVVNYTDSWAGLRQRFYRLAPAD